MIGRRWPTWRSDLGAFVVVVVASVVVIYGPMAIVLWWRGLL